jgi:hypothetical protein
MKKHWFRITIILIAICFISKLSYAGVHVEGTFVLKEDQYPLQLAKFKPTQIYLGYSGTLGCLPTEFRSYDKDTIINLKSFFDSLNCDMNPFFRIIFQDNNNKIDSIWECDLNFNITKKFYPLLINNTIN